MSGRWHSTRATTRANSFGLMNVFQALVNDFLPDIISSFGFVSLDDILFFSPTLEEHVQHVWLVLKCLLENQLFVKAE